MKAMKEEDKPCPACESQEEIEFLYMGMGYCNDHMVCMSVGYNLDYAVKKAMQFEIASGGKAKFESVNEVRIGDTEKFGSWSREAVRGYIKSFLQNEYLD